MAVVLIPANPGYVVYTVRVSSLSTPRDTAVVAWAVQNTPTYSARPVVLSNNQPVTASPGTFIGIGIPGNGIEPIKPGQSLLPGYVLKAGTHVPRTINSLPEFVHTIETVWANLVLPSEA